MSFGGKSGEFLGGVEGISPEFMLERCFYQFQNAASVSGLEKQLVEMEQKREGMVVENEAVFKAWFKQFCKQKEMA